MNARKMGSARWKDECVVCPKGSMQGTLALNFADALELSRSMGPGARVYRARDGVLLAYTVRGNYNKFCAKLS